MKERVKRPRKGPRESVRPPYVKELECAALAADAGGNGTAIYHTIMALFGLIRVTPAEERAAASQAAALQILKGLRITIKKRPRARRRG